MQIMEEQYIGQNLRRIKDKIYEHLGDMEQANIVKPLGTHFVSIKHEQ